METEQNTRRWKELPHSWTGRNNIVKMVTLLKTIYRFSGIPINIYMSFFTETERSILKFTWKHKRPQIAKAILVKKKKSNAEGVLIPDFKLCYTTVVTKTA
jgi:hypothetical protein